MWRASQWPPMQSLKKKRTENAFAVLVFLTILWCIGFHTFVWGQQVKLSLWCQSSCAMLCQNLIKQKNPNLKDIRQIKAWHVHQVFFFLFLKNTKRRNYLFFFSNRNQFSALFFKLFSSKVPPALNGKFLHNLAYRNLTNWTTFSLCLFIGIPN